MESYDKATLSKLFNDYISKQNISTNEIKAIYLQNFLNDKVGIIYAIIGDNIHVFAYRSERNNNQKFITDLRIIKKNCVKEVHYSSIGDVYRNIIDEFAITCVDVILSSGENLSFSNVDDSIPKFKSDYTEMILSFISHL
jgi:hypothetical protein